jgi:ferritin-like metal-binding protein YciE
MTSPQQQKIVQYLNEAQATELALIRVLQAQIAMTPRGSYRSALETHLRETRDHASRIARRLQALDAGSNPLQAVVGLAESVIGQLVALGKTPLDLLRGSGGEEKVLKNAKDAAATEALEIATYTALERLANAVGDDETADLAASIRADEEKMLARVLRELPNLTDAVVRADIDRDRSYNLATTGAVEAVKRTGPAPAKSDLAIARYDSLSADEITSRLLGLSQTELAKIDAYERRGQDRTTVLNRIDTLRGDEPLVGYDELTAAEVQSALSAGDEELATKVRSYERAHKNRAGVLKAADRQHSNA